MKAGEEKAWADLELLDPVDVCERSLSSYNPSDASYMVSVFGHPVNVTPKERTMSGAFSDSELILTKTGYFSRLAILHYLIGAQACPLLGQLIKPSDLKVGPIYFTGSHVLPLTDLAAKYARDTEGFAAQGIRFGGERQTYGDVAVRLCPLPRLPLTVILWREDDEFPARAELLFDSTCERHVPPDILWSVAMLSVLLMTK